MIMTEEEAQLILAAVYNMRDEQEERSKYYLEHGFDRAGNYFRNMYYKYNNLYKKLINELADITE